MKRSSLTENNFEVEHVISALIENGYVERTPENYDHELLLDPEILLEFLKTTQPAEWRKLEEQYPEETEKRFLKHVSTEIGKRGTLHVLRNAL
jgi:type I restriction enzyme R subunit